MSIQVFLRDCSKFVLYIAKLIGLVTPQFYQLNIAGINKIISCDETGATTTTEERGSKSDPFPTTDATTTNNRQLLCDDINWWRGWCSNRITRWRIYVKTLVCFLLYPLAMFFVKRCSADNTTDRISYFNLFAFITLYFHYALMLVIAVKVVMVPPQGLTDALTQLHLLIQSICHSLKSSPFRDLQGLPREKSYAGAGEQSEPWTRSYSIDLGLKCGLLGMTFVILCWLSINLPLLDADNWITILCASLILILPTIIMLLFSHLFFGLSLILECVLTTLNHWLRIHGMQGVSKSAHEKGNKLRQLSICDNVDIIVQYYSRTLRLLKQLNRFHAVPILVIILNCFFTIAVQSFAIYMTFSSADAANATDEIRQQQVTINSISMQNDSNRSSAGGGSDVGGGYGPVGSGIGWSGIGQQQDVSGGGYGASKESPQTVPHLYIMAVNSVYILINYLELCALIRASTCHRTLVRTTFEILNADFPDQISLDARLGDSIEFLYLELLQHEEQSSRVSAGGLFVIDFSLITMVTGAAVGYLIILMQYEMEV